ncbi:MAG: 23S rRNA (adenine(2503)-C(2))-methyltransferase RlmN [Candidatus Paceibacterota bacterium]|jgi:23S rRNA (adenine2503-C2)-methyltransferase|nr:23S rRNA (adenine(2503)-C(2))-methyltransferase RlmN [Candidatus Paceibacterota bacterium]
MNWKKLEEILKSEPGYRSNQVKKLIFHDLIEGWDQATNLSLSLREKLKKEVLLDIKAKLFKSKDKQTIKGLIELENGLKIETVLMLRNDKRSTVCVSSQVGCPLDCLFCATGKMGFQRNLTHWEILEQVLLFTRYLKKKKINNIVFMGMGEPFLNYDNVMEAIKTINDADCFNVGARKISISTAGIFSGIEKLSKEDIQINLSISLHAPNNQLRDRIMPINKKYPLSRVLDKADDYVKKTNRKVMLEYLMIKGLNDSLKEAEELYRLIKNRPLYMVNLIRYNPTGGFKGSDTKTVKAFKDYLEKKGIFATQRYEFGKDIKGACGQLIAGGENK